MTDLDTIIGGAQQAPPEAPPATQEAPAETDEGKLLRLATEREALRQAVIAAQEALDANTFALADLVPGPDKGQRSKKASEDLKVVVKRDMILKPDEAKIRELLAELSKTSPDPLFPPLKIKTSCEIDQKGYKWYEKNMPEVWKKIAELVTAKPAKVSVEVKPV
jgi:hypothetical protein